MRLGHILLIVLLSLGLGAAAISFSQEDKLPDKMDGPYRAFYIDQAPVGEGLTEEYGDLVHVRKALNSLYLQGYEFVAFEYLDPGRLMVVCRK